RVLLSFPTRRSSDLIQYEPRRGDGSDVRTEALVLYDAGHVFVAFRAWDPEPITAQLTFRDADLFTDDAVAVVLDTTFDRRSGYDFITNALGTQACPRAARSARPIHGSDHGSEPATRWQGPGQHQFRREPF